MDRNIRAILTLAACILFTSCSSYTTPIYNDPFFKTPTTELKVLQEGGEPYTQRGENLADKNSFSPRADEKFDEYTDRIVNTLAIQEYQIEQIVREIDKKTTSIERLGIQVPTLQAKHVDLRLDLMRVTSSDALMDSKGKLLFKKHVVNHGETLQKISMLTYGTYTGWLCIYRFNLEQLPNGPNRIYPGQILYLPMVTSEDL
jgi:nucleoid-associated protein YgaU